MSRRHPSRPETAFPKRRIGDLVYYTSRTGFDDASLTTYRFPCRLAAKTGPDFVLVHGIGVSARMYGPTAAALALHGDVHLIDLAGYGRSPRPGRDLPLAEHAELVARYLEQKSLDHPVVVGHSMGSQVVAELAANHPGEVDHIVLIAPVVAPTARSLAKVGALMGANALREPIHVALLALYDYLFRAGVGYMLQQTPHVLGTDLDELASRIEAKALVICGREDPIVPLDWGRELAARFRHGWFAEVEGPHATMFAAPAAIAELIDEHAHR